MENGVNLSEIQYPFLIAKVYRWFRNSSFPRYKYGYSTHEGSVSTSKIHYPDISIIKQKDFSNGKV